MRSVLFLALILCNPLLSPGQDNPNENLVVVFYNVENLFDTRDDRITSDEDFTPAGTNHWTKTHLNEKLTKISQAILAAGKGRFPDIIGFAEIENYGILENFLENTPFGKENYGIIHKESPDPRGIDVALLYRKERITPIDLNFIAVKGDSDAPFLTRDILYFKGVFKSNPIHFFINHWPSRSSGYTESREKRNNAAFRLRQFIDSLQIAEPEASLLLMGDFNATPREECFSKILETTLKQTNPASAQLVNLSLPWLKSGQGTVQRAGVWEVFDQFICSGNLLIPGNKLLLLPSATRICTEPFLLETDQRYLGKKPYRTFMGPAYHGGFSDHLPIATELRAMPTPAN